MALAAIAGSLGACAKVDRLATVSSTVPDDYRDRHPLVIANKPYATNVFISGKGLTDADELRVTAFARVHAKFGRGPIHVSFPQGAKGSYRARRALGAIRRALVAGGAKGSIRVGGYPVQDPSVASPVRLTFVGLKAKVANKCGEWPRDLASASSLHTWQNKQYWNMGCSYQQMFAAQVADPRDLAGPRGETPPDIGMRMRAIEKVRKGTDPATNWKVTTTAVGG